MQRARAQAGRALAGCAPSPTMSISHVSIECVSSVRREAGRAPPRLKLGGSMHSAHVGGMHVPRPSRITLSSRQVAREGGEAAAAMKYVLVTGGVVSGLGKGVTASSIGVLLKACGHRVTSVGGGGDACCQWPGNTGGGWAKAARWQACRVPDDAAGTQGQQPRTQPAPSCWAAAGGGRRGGSLGGWLVHGLTRLALPRPCPADQNRSVKGACDAMPLAGRPAGVAVPARAGRAGRWRRPCKRAGPPCLPAQQGLPWPVFPSPQTHTSTWTRAPCRPLSTARCLCWTTAARCALG